MINNTYHIAGHLNGHLMAAVDIETTGRLPGYHEIIQIAVVPLDADYQALPRVSPYYVNIAPEYPERAEKKALSINGLNLEKLRQESITQEKGADLFVEWVENLNLPINKRLIPLAHNWAFEDGFLKHWLGLETKDAIWQGTARDSMIYANGVNDWAANRGSPPVFKNVSLLSLQKTLKVKSPGKSHDALNDAMVCAEVYKRLLQLYPCP